MAQLFSHPAGILLLESLRVMFQNKPVFLGKHPFIIFVCGGRLGESAVSLRERFIEWAEHQLPNFICLLAEDALKDGFAGEGRKFINLRKFESVIADVADCVLVFPESPGSYAETGFFSNSPNIRKKTLIVNPISEQTDSFLNRGPIDTIDRLSFLQPTVYIEAVEPADFTLLGQRLVDRMKLPHREQLEYRQFRQFNFKEKLLVLFGLLKFLRLADAKTLRHAISVCFGSMPQLQELTHLLRILQAAKFIHRHRESQYFKVVTALNLLEVDNVEFEKIFAQVTSFYQKYSPPLFEALPEVTQ